MSGRLIVISNRLASVQEGEAPVGGLAVAVHAAFQELGGIWFGWSGELAAAPSAQASINKTNKISYATVDLTRRDHHEYYSCFANGVLWPLFHYRPDLIDYHRRDFEGYLRVNEQFAKALVPLLEDDDTIWIHDYHLMPLGQALRRRHVANRIGFFLHTPFPAWQLMQHVPPHHTLMQEMLALDLIGFQTEDDRTAFLDYMRREAGFSVDKRGTIVGPERAVRTGAFPIGIETANVIEIAQHHDSSPQSRRLSRTLQNRALILGVDRLDYSKGLVNRFHAFERMLELYPRERGRVTLMQIAPPSRTNVGGYREIRRELELSASSINGRFGDFDWVPIRYINRSYSQDDLASFYRKARVGLVTPLRDGMNLVAKEYVASQNPHDPGVLVLSRFAGAARELTGALIVNPYDLDDVAEALHTALGMAREERIARWKSMMGRLKRRDVHAWRRDFLSTLADGQR